MASTLARASFGDQVSGWTNLKLVSGAGVAVGNTLTVTLPNGATLAGVVKRLGTNGSVYINVTAVSRPSGLLLLPKGSAVA